MKKWQSKYGIGLVLCLFVVVLVIGIASDMPSERPVTTWEPTTIHAKTITIRNQTAFDAARATLDGDMSVSENILIDPTEPITGNLTNFAQLIGRNIEFSASCGATTVIMLDQVTNNGIVRIYGSPDVTIQQCDIQNNLQIYDNPTVNVTDTVVDNYLGLPVIINVDGTSTILFSNTNISGEVEVTGVDPTVTVTFDHCKIENTTIKSGHLLTYLQDCNLTRVFVESDSTTTIQNTIINIGLYETIKPTLTPDTTSIAMPYNFVFEPEKSVSLSWSGSDNIVGAAYALTYRLVVYQDGQVVQNFTQTVTTAQVSVKTASNNVIHLTAIDDQGNVSTTAIISIVRDPNMLGFILMIVSIAGGAVGVVLILYLRKQRQWQKTTLMEIPT